MVSHDKLLLQSQEYVALFDENIKAVEWEKLVEESNKGLSNTKENQKSYIINQVIEQLVNKNHIKIQQKSGKQFIYR